jgi:hypothetical protein
MSSATSTSTGGSRTARTQPDPGLHPWQFFVLLSLAAATAAVLVSRQPTPEHLVLISLAIGAAGCTGYAAYRMLSPLFAPERRRAAETMGHRTRAALEREKMLTLRSIKELEFDRAMGKIAQKDFDEMSARLRARALTLMSQLEAGEVGSTSLQARPGNEAKASYHREDEAKASYHRKAEAKASDHRCACGTTNDNDARFCKRCGAKLAAALLLALFIPTLVGAQGPQMPDPKQMSGVPLPSGDLPAGTVSVRLVKGGPGNNLPGQTVELIVAGRARTEKTDQNGRAQFSSIAPGAEVKARAVVAAETLESQTFPMPSSGGIRLMLVATDPEAERVAEESAKLAAGPAQPGTVIIGGDSRFVIEQAEDALTVYYLLTLRNSARTPVMPSTPLVFDLPTGAAGATILEGSTPNARVAGARVTVTGPFPPGATTVQVAFNLPHGGGSVTFAQPLPATLEQVLVIAEKSADLRLTSPQTPNQRETPADGRIYIVASGPAIGTGGALQLTIDGLPGHAKWPRYLALAMAGAILFAGAWGAWTAPARIAD